jgi:hypothetical protein
MSVDPWYPNDGPVTVTWAVWVLPAVFEVLEVFVQVQLSSVFRPAFANPRKLASTEIVSPTL